MHSLDAVLDTLSQTWQKSSRLSATCQNGSGLGRRGQSHISYEVWRSIEFSK